MSTDFVYPERNLPGRAENWGRAVEARDKILEKDLRQAVQKIDNGLRATGGQLAVIGTQIDLLAAQQQVLADQQAELSNQQATINSTLARLEDAGKVVVNSVGTSWTSGAAGWVSSPPSVTASSMSKRFRVTVTAGASGGTAFVTFSATGFDRDRALGASPTAIRSRGSALGGASDPGTASRAFIVTMPGTGPYTFTAQAYRTDEYVSVIGLEIMVESIL